MLARGCIEPGCRATTTKGSRCPTHSQRKERVRSAERRKTRQVATAVRRRLNQEAGSYVCVKCGKPYSVAWVVVDHILPLADGGTDTLENLQILCVACHKTKTAQEATRRAG